MLWVVTENESLQITRCNTFEKDGVHQVWVERSNGKTFKLKESTDRNDVQEIKEAIDYAISKGISMLNLKEKL